MKRFIKITAAFMAPVLIITAVFFAVLWRTGELDNTQTVFDAAQNNTLNMFGFAYRDNTRALKHNIAAEKKASLLVLGTSRSMQFRGAFFTESSFYNAGGGIAFATQAQYFLESLPADALPDNLLLVLDQYFYNEDWANIDDNRDTEPYEYTKPETWYMLRRSMEDYLDGKYTIMDAMRTQSGVYGLSAAVRSSGFYADGSYSYGDAAVSAADGAQTNFADSRSRIAAATSRFEYGDTVNAAVLERTEALLKFCNDNNIKVTAILPPYAPAIWQTMKDTGQYTYIDKILPELAPLFAKYGFEVFDYTDMPETSDDMYIDGFHGSDRVYAAVCVRLAQSSSFLADKINADECAALFSSDGSPLALDFTAFSQ